MYIISYHFYCYTLYVFYNILIYLILAIATYEEIKSAHEHSTARIRLGLRVGLLIGNIPV